MKDESVRAMVVPNPWTKIPSLSVEGEFKDGLIKGWKRGTNRSKHGSNDVDRI
jgi:hypothetical protein